MWKITHDSENRSRQWGEHECHTNLLVRLDKFCVDSQYTIQNKVQVTQAAVQLLLEKWGK
jgi:hypothetical protein